MTLYKDLKGYTNENGEAIKVPVWPLVLTLWQYAQDEVTPQQAAARFPMLSQTGRASLATIVTQMKARVTAGDTKLEVLLSLWFDFAAVEFGYLSELNFNSKYGL